MRNDWRIYCRYKRKTLKTRNHMVASNQESTARRILWDLSAWLEWIIKIAWVKTPPVCYRFSLMSSIQHPGTLFTQRPGWNTVCNYFSPVCCLVRTQMAGFTNFNNAMRVQDKNTHFIRHLSTLLFFLPETQNGWIYESPSFCTPYAGQKKLKY